MSSPPTGDHGRDLRTALRNGLLAPAPPEALRFVELFRRNHGAELAAVVLYGSRLSAGDATRSGLHDFFLLTDHLRRFHGDLLQAALNLVVPPNIYYATVASSDGPPLRCKYSVLSLDQFRRQTSAEADDIYHLGRFSKRVLLAYARDAQVEAQVVDGLERAVLALVPHALARLPETFTLDQAVGEVLGLSYLGEQRIAEPTKIDKLVSGDRDYYREVFALALAHHAVRRGAPLRTGATYRHDLPDAASRRRTERFLARSRRRGVLRWPKFALTVDDWLQIELDKLERNHGVRLELTERERRHPLIFGWGRFLELRRKGIIK
ncbi:MAG: hypothetical protein IT371_24130 [Deltaproteobacteria bacterium]|nr:hypothetical protein [Deltaproteobacteria bacterium]